MGQDQSCVKLNKMSNACEMSTCIKKVEGLPASSSSPCDTWVLYFKDGVVYENEPYTHAFLKYFLSPKFFDDVDYDIPADVLGLTYELYVYKDIIRPLIDNKICPNFIKYLGSGIDCSFNDMTSMLESTFADEKVLINRFSRSCVCMLNNIKDRPSITEEINQREVIFDLKDKDMYSFNLIVNEVMDGDTKFFDEWICSFGGTIRYSEFYPVLFQIAIACYVLGLTKTIHNDMHGSNIFVVPIKHPITYFLQIGEADTRIFRFDNIGWLAKIYDFDRSYTEQLGNNMLVNEYGEFSMYNKVQTNKDILKVFLSVINTITDEDDKKELIEIISKDDAHSCSIIARLSLEPTKLQIEGLIFTDKSVIKHVKPIEEILTLLADKCKQYEIFRANKLDEHTYICSPKLFDDKGKIVSL